MDLIELVPRLHFLRFPVGHCYLWRDPDGLTLIDTSTPGSGPLIASAIRALGHQPADLRRLVLTHFHPDHAGSAAEIAAWGEVTVCAHRADVPFIQGQAAGPPPDITASERPLFERIQAQAPPAPVAPVGVDRALDDGDDLGFGDGALVVAVPGHTPGSVAVYLRRHGFCSPGTPSRGRAADTSSSGRSTPTRRRRQRPSAGWRPSVPR